MTQILTAIAKNYAFHVSDRLVTLRRGGSEQPHDRLANKSVVFRAKGAIVVIGYTGFAFLDGVPTDTWIVNTLLARSETDYASITVLEPNSYQWLGIHEAIRHLSMEYNAAYNRMPKQIRNAVPHGFNIVGWMYDKRRRRFRPYSCEMLSSTSDPSLLEISTMKKAWGWHRFLGLTFTPDCSSSNVEWTKKNLSQRGLRSPEAFEDVMVESLRRIAEKRTNVGEICMCIRIRPFLHPNVQIRYADPATENTVLPPASGKRSAVIEAYTPYIIAPPTVWAPSSVYGGDGGSTKITDDYSFDWELVGLKRENPPAQFARGYQSRPIDPSR